MSAKSTTGLAATLELPVIVFDVIVDGQAHG
jgi:hypothetical protein